MFAGMCIFVSLRKRGYAHVFKNAHGDLFCVKFVHGHPAAVGPHFSHKLRLPDKFFHSRRQGLRVAQRYKIAVIAVAHNLTAARGICHHRCAAHAHALHDGGGRAFAPGGQHHHMGGAHIGAHIARFAKVFYAALGLPLAHGFKAYAAKPLFGRAEQQKTCLGVRRLERTGRLGVFFKPFGFKQPGYQQKNRRSFKAAVSLQPGQRGGCPPRCRAP